MIVNNNLDDKRVAISDPIPDIDSRLLEPCYDNVEKPLHYNKGKVECIDAIDSATVDKNGLEAVCTANVIKYLWRYETKGGLEDVKKAKWYLDKLISHLKENM